MKYIIPALLAFVLAMPLVAKENEATVRELMRAMSSHYYERILPKDLTEEEFVYLSLLYPDGETRDLVGGNGFKGGEKVKVFAFLRMDDRYVTLLREDGGSMTANGLPEWEGFSPSQKDEGEIDDHMIRFTSDGQIQLGEKPRQGCYDLIITTKEFISDRIKIEINETGYRFKGEPLSIKELKDKISTIPTDGSVTIVADEAVPLKKVTSVLDSLKDQGISDVSIGASKSEPNDADNPVNSPENPKNHTDD